MMPAVISKGTSVIIPFQLYVLLQKSPFGTTHIVASPSSQIDIFRRFLSIVGFLFLGRSAITLII